jgi:ribosomal protein S24E
MDLEIIKQKKLPLLSRERITAYAHFTGATPSRQGLMAGLAKKVKAKENHIIIRHIYQRFGHNKAKIIAHVYADETMMKTLEPTNLLKKHGLVEQKEEAKETEEKK